jgi:hypothetical protein
MVNHPRRGEAVESDFASEVTGAGVVTEVDAFLLFQKAMLILFLSATLLGSLGLINFLRFDCEFRFTDTY